MVGLARQVGRSHGAAPEHSWRGWRCLIASNPALPKRKSFGYLSDAEKHGLFVDVKRFLDERFQHAPAFAARTGSLQQEVIGVVAEDTLQTGFPTGVHPWQTMAVFE